MSWLSTIFGLEKNLDDVAYKDLEELEQKLTKLNGNLSHLKALLSKIREFKREKKTINPKIRENFLATIDVVRMELLEALRLEEKIKKEEIRQEKSESASTNGEKVITKDYSGGFKKLCDDVWKEDITIGSASNCTIVIPGLNDLHATIGHGLHFPRVTPHGNMQIWQKTGKKNIVGYETCAHPFELHFFRGSNKVAVIIFKG